MEIDSVRLIKNWWKHLHLPFLWQLNGQRTGVYRSRRFSSSCILLQIFHSQKLILSDGIDRECTLQMQTSNSLCISAQGFLRINTNSWVNSTTLILLALNTRISYEWLYQNLWTKYIIKSVGWNLSDGKNAHKHSTFINPSNSAFYKHSLSEFHPTDPSLKIDSTLVRL